MVGGAARRWCPCRPDRARVDGDRHQPPTPRAPGPTGARRGFADLLPSPALAGAVGCRWSCPRGFRGTRRPAAAAGCWSLVAPRRALFDLSDVTETCGNARAWPRLPPCVFRTSVALRVPVGPGLGVGACPHQPLRHRPPQSDRSSTAFCSMRGRLATPSGSTPGSPPPRGRPGWRCPARRSTTPSPAAAAPDAAPPWCGG
jgi:hypothetical protein